MMPVTNPHIRLVGENYHYVRRRPVLLASHQKYRRTPIKKSLGTGARRLASSLAIIIDGKIEQDILAQSNALALAAAQEFLGGRTLAAVSSPDIVLSQATPSQVQSKVYSLSLSDALGYYEQKRGKKIKHKTLDRVRRAVKRFCEYMKSSKDLPIATVTRARVVNYIDYRERLREGGLRGHSGKTLRDDIGFLSIIWKLNQHHNEITQLNNPFSSHAIDVSDSVSYRCFTGPQLQVLFKIPVPPCNLRR